MPEEAPKIIGTSAELSNGDKLSVWDLLHGLMLPSGNDAAFTLASYFGDLLLNKSRKTAKTLFFTNQARNKLMNIIFQKDYRLEENKGSANLSQSSEMSDEPSTKYADDPFVTRFLEEMNKNARKLGMADTNFDSPHGLPNKNNKSTAHDIAKLCLE